MSPTPRINPPAKNWLSAKKQDQKKSGLKKNESPEKKNSIKSENAAKHPILMMEKNKRTHESDLFFNVKRGI